MPSAGGFIAIGLSPPLKFLLDYNDAPITHLILREHYY